MVSIFHARMGEADARQIRLLSFDRGRAPIMSKRLVVCVAIIVGCFCAAPRALAEEPPCTGTDLSVAQAALTDLQERLHEVSDGLRGPNPSALKKAITWLGSKSPSDTAKIGDVIERMAAYAKGVTFRCAVRTDMRRGDVYAYVRPDKSFAIVLADFFFRAPETGFDSKLGVLAHELSHFVLVGETKDSLYGAASAKALAARDPDAAQRNADNYEYFIEAVVFGL